MSHIYSGLGVPDGYVPLRPTRLVPNVAGTAEYYREVLGFSVICQRIEPSSYAVLQREGRLLHFAEGNVAGDSPNLFCMVPDLAEFYVALRRTQAVILAPPHKNTQGMLTMEVQDCNGYCLQFVEILRRWKYPQAAAEVAELLPVEIAYLEKQIA